MTALEWGVQALLLGLLGVALPFLLRLERQLRAIRAERGAMADGEAGLRQASEAAESAALRLRAVADGAGRGLAERVAKAEPLRDDLRFLTERAEALADRLDGLVRAARPLAPARAVAAEPPQAERVPSQAERDLMRALGITR
ncbi:hypothetical protein C8P66_1213 [Humitalea rosea]|uniref:DUF6468 domain-containing protein n=1 Tax=Humitalea rosea TaxID=990373 RepID=A0A2W7I3E8_9PROT|nr:DUF6468 domain-containing protein [Humitalea rosea]PZW41296.1 hypothetical protein C8P66_1213 [Humitalea rosea]